MNQNNRLFIDIHILQTVPPSCINRDDTGSPKTAQFGGTNRARVSSQAWKHAIRKNFRDNNDSSWTGDRTLLVLPKVAEKIKSIDPNMNADELAKKAFERAGVTISKFSKEIQNVTEGPKALFFISDAQAEALAALVVEDEKKEISEKNNSKNNDDKKKNDNYDREKYIRALNSYPSVDIALFGRMVADNNDLNHDACVQVAHSISTHEVRTEYDYFNAEDDCKDKPGAGYLDTNEFSSSTLYRYATIDVCSLHKNPNINTAEAVKGFAEAFIKTMPTGKQNSYANNTIPEMVYIAVRDDQPINLVGAFEKPVATRGNGYFIPSEKAFTAYTRDTYDKFVPKPIVSWGVSRGESLSEITDIESLSLILEKLESFIVDLYK